MSDFLQNLSAEQRAAVEYVDGPELVIAGAGSGKTRVLTYKIAHLLGKGVPPEHIMALTFTNKAAREMKERIAMLVGPASAARLWMGTFHSILLRILRQHADRLGFRYDFTIYDTADSRSLVKIIVAELGLDDKQYKPASVAAAISNAKNALVSPQRYAASDHDGRNGKPMLADIYRLYCDRTRLAQAMDFDDILYYANVLLRDNEDLARYYSDYFRYILVDEYQDTNFAQSLVVNRLTQRHRRLCVVGDDAQSIYGFRGADIGNILGMPERYPDLRLFKLERNYRSTRNIVGAAGSLIKHNHGQIPKEVYSENEAGEKIEVVEAFSDIEEASFVAAAVSRRLRLSPCDSLEDMAILYRTNAQSRTLEEALRRRAIPYRIYGGLTFYQRKEVKDALAYFRLAVNPDDDEALRRIINLPARGIGDTTVKKIRAAAVGKGVSMWSVVSDPASVGLPVSRTTAARLTAFADMMRGFQKKAAFMDAYSLGCDIYNGAGLLAMYASTSTPEEVSKHENLNELLNGLKEFTENRDEGANASMGAFLSDVSLLTDQDADDEDADEARLTLMTVHAAKGLEFNHVFITGLEENLFPGAQAIDEPSGIEEERRLLYVAITRARKSVMLSYAKRRFRNGKTEDTLPSRFLLDIDVRYLNGLVPMRPTTGRNTTATIMPRPRSGIRPVADDIHLTPVRRTSRHEVTATVDIPHDAPYVPGEKVRHAKFGTGTVKAYMAHPEPMLLVDFDDFGPKKLILRFATLTKE